MDEHILCWRASISVTVRGLFDVLTPTALWEIKCAQSLGQEHFAQLAVYAWLHMKRCAQTAAFLPSSSSTTPASSTSLPPSFRFCLLNVLSSEMWEISTDALDQVMQLLLLHYFRPSDLDSSDAEFVAQAM